MVVQGGIFIVTKLTLDQIGRMYCTLSILRRDEDEMTPLLFKVDTGADFTTISKTALYGLGYDRDWIEENKKLMGSKIITLASGEKVNTYFVQLPVIDICGYQALNWPFAIILDDGADYRPLLGLNLLAYFNMKLDNDNGLLELSHASTEPKIEMLFHDQEIFKANLSQTVE